MPIRALFAVVSAAVLTATTGCGPGKLNKSASFALGADKAAVGYEGNKQSSEQTLKIEVEADSGVDVFVVTGLTLEDAVNTLGHELKKVSVASKQDTTKDSFTAAIPAGQKPVVVITLGTKSRKASGSVKITN